MRDCRLLLGVCYTHRVLGGLLAAQLMVGAHPQAAQSPPPQPSAPIKTIAVMPFKVVGAVGPEAAVAANMSDMLATNLAESKDIRIVERSQVDQALKNFKVEDSGLIDRDTAAKLGGWMGATHVGTRDVLCTR